MSYNSKNLIAVAEIIYSTSRPNLSERACQKTYEQKETTYFNPFSTDVFSLYPSQD